MSKSKENINLTYLPFKLLFFAGQNILENQIIWTILDSIIVGGCFILCLLEPILHYQGPETVAGALEVGGPSHQWIVKLIIYKWYRGIFLHLIADQERFWPLNYEGPVIEKQLTWAFTTVKRGFQVFLACSTVAEALMAIRPIIMLLVTDGNHELPIVMYNIVDLTKSPFYEIAYVIDVAYLYVIVCFVVGFDGMFMALCTGAAGQLVLIKHAMSRLEPNNYKQLLPIYVEHHDFILEFIKKLRTIFSILLLNQFLSSMLCVCMAIYLTTSQGTTDYVFIARCGLFAVAGVIQIFIYCFTGTTIKSQMDTVSEAIYSSGWCESINKDMKLAVLMITQRAQNTRSFKAGGMIDLDLQSFVAILRMSFSFFTLMQSSNAQTTEIM